ncbi:MAG TPA: ClpXP protease specificity-enhancing factor [Gammaproteobacteria bacterium]|jgi:stringent starvation protein B|nr:ClpXP protease specificity-enhancing factor [Gammaproteobacteria bacterium]
MLSNRPYLLRAFYQWIVDSGCTPILVIDATNSNSRVPEDFIEGGEIVFNIAPVAVRDFQITNQQIEFRASFSGVAHNIAAPVNAILAIYAEENGEGLFLDAEEDEGEVGTQNKRSHLVGIDGSNAESIDGFEVDPTVIPPVKAKPVLKLVE